MKQITQPQALQHDTQSAGLSERLPVLVYYSLLYHPMCYDTQGLPYWLISQRTEDGMTEGKEVLVMPKLGP